MRMMCLGYWRFGLIIDSNMVCNVYYNYCTLDVHGKMMGHSKNPNYEFVSSNHEAINFVFLVI